MNYERWQLGAVVLDETYFFSIWLFTSKRGYLQDEAADVLTRVATFDRKTKANLHLLYEEIEDILKSDNCFPEVKEEMSAEFGDINKVIYQKKSDVYDELCPIVITGLYFVLQVYI